METVTTIVRKFELGDTVKVNTISIPNPMRNDKLQVVDYWWQDYYPKSGGSWIYRVAFITKKGAIDTRKNYRQFEESRLTKILWKQ